MRWGLVILFLTITFGGTYLSIWMRPKDHAERFSFEVLKEYPHDASAFTQGILMDDGFLWESTGRYGESTIRKTNLQTGEIIHQQPLDDKYFGEGLTIFNDQLIQLTWKSGIALVYDRDLNQIGELNYEDKTEQGWGLTTNGTDLIFSSGNAEIKFLDPKTFKIRRTIRVRRKSGYPVGRLNELEFYGGRIFANDYQTDIIYEIDPESGIITRVINLHGLWPKRERPTDGILNGIAVDPKTKHLLVTGKLCPKVWELRLFPEEN